MPANLNYSVVLQVYSEKLEENVHSGKNFVVSTKTVAHNGTYIIYCSHSNIEMVGLL